MTDIGSDHGLRMTFLKVNRKRLKESAKRFEMQISEEKAKGMIMGTNEDVAVTIAGEVRKIVRQLKYLRATITNDARSNQKS